jgi:hypothetical protein
MSDTTELLPAWAIEALRRPVRGRRGDARDRIMDAVRAAPIPQRAPLAFGLRRPGILNLGVGLAAAASLAAVLATGGMRRTIAATEGAATVSVIGDSIGAIGGTLRDTLRLVRFVLEAPAATRVALVSDFTAWAPAALERERNGRWSATVALPKGHYAYAFVVDDTQRVQGPSLAESRISVVPAKFEGDSL